MTKVIIVGAGGRMGTALHNCAARQPARFKLIAEIGRGDDLEAALADTDVVIDFSVHSATEQVAALCVRHGKGLVIGTTGIEEPARSRLRSLSQQIPMVWSSNFSTGVNTLFWLTRKATEILGPEFDLEVVEMHHRLKKDAPSGTATTLAEILAGVRGKQLEEVIRHGRSGLVGERTRAEIGMHALRGGDVVGDHTVIFASVGERVELAHKASSRDTFANGALRAAEWLVGKPAGLYDMQDVLGLRGK